MAGSGQPSESQRGQEAGTQASGRRIRLPTLREALALAKEDVPALDRVSYRIHDVLRPHEARRIERRLSRLSGVLEASVDTGRDVVQVGLVGRKTPPALIHAMLQGAGVRATEIEEHRVSEPHQIPHSETLPRTARRATLLIACALTAGLVVKLAHGWSTQVRQIAQNVQALMTVAVVVWAMRPSVDRLLRNLRSGRVTSNTLPLLTGLGLAAASVVYFALGEEPFFEASLLALGAGVWVDYLALKLRVRARRSLYSWRENLDVDAQVLNRAGLFIVNAQDVAAGDTIVVHHGQTLPVDGNVVKGSCFVDDGKLSSRTQHRQCGPGDRVWAGTTVLGGTIAVRVTHKSEASALAEIADRLERIGADETWLRRRVSRVSLWASVVALGVAGLVFAWMTLELDELGDLGGGAVEACLAILLITAPMAFARLYDPAFYITIGESAQGGALYKDMASLDRMGTLRQLYFYRTGTLTVGHPEIAGWVLAPGASRDEVLGLVLGLEAESQHPLAVSLCEYARENIEDINQAASPAAVNVVPARGVMGYMKDGRIVRFGNREMMGDAEMALEEGPCRADGEGVEGDPRQDSLMSVDTVVYLAVDEQILARFHFSDPIRSEAPAAIRELEKLGVSSALLTGDSAAAAAAVSEATGVAVAGFGLTTGEMRTFVHMRTKDASGGVALVSDTWQTDLRMEACPSIRFGTGMRFSDDDDDVTIFTPSLNALVGAVRRAKALRLKRRRLGLMNTAYCVSGWAVAATGLLPLWLAATIALAYAGFTCAYSYAARGEG